MKKLNKIEVKSYDELKSISFKKAVKNAIIVREKGGATLTVIYCTPYYHLTGLVYFKSRLIKEYPQYADFNYFESGKKVLRSFNDEILTKADLSKPLANYDDFKRRQEFINNVLPREFDHINIFQKDFDGKSKNYPFKSALGIDYFHKKEEADMISDCFFKNENENKEKLENDNNYFAEAVRFEFDNFEVCVSGDPTDAINALSIDVRKLNHVKLGILNHELIKRQCEAF